MKGEVTFAGVRPAGQDAATIRQRLGELLMAWATDRQSRAAKYILEVDRGLRCNCVCPACDSALEAVNSRNPKWRKRPHFRHVDGTETDQCAVLAARHALRRALAELADSRGESFELPGRTRTVQATGISGAIYVGSASIDRLQVVPAAVQLVDAQSAVIRLDSGREVLVQIVATMERTADLPAEQSAVIQIVADRAELAALSSLSPQEIRSRLRVLLQEGHWCRHWDDAALDAAAAKSARDQAALHIDLHLDVDGQQITNYETALHIAVKEIIAESKAMQLPGLYARVERDVGLHKHWLREWSRPSWRATFTDVRLEERVGSAVPDVVAEAEDGTLLIEVTVSNPLNSDREERFEQLGAAVLEIDLRAFAGSVTRDQLRSIVVDGLQGKRWVHHPLEAAEKRRLIDACAASTGPLAGVELARLVDDARDHALAYYDADFDSALQVPLLEALRELEDRGFPGAASWEFYGQAGLLPRLLSIYLGRPVGYAVDSVFQVLNAIKQSRSQQWAPLYLMALKVYEPELSDKHREWVESWARDVRNAVNSGDPDVRMPGRYDEVIGLFFPQLDAPLAKFRKRPLRVRSSDAQDSTSTTTLPPPPFSSALTDQALARASGQAAGAGQMPLPFARQYAQESGTTAKAVLERLRSLGLVNNYGRWSSD